MLNPPLFGGVFGFVWGFFGVVFLFGLVWFLIFVLLPHEVEFSPK